MTRPARAEARGQASYAGDLSAQEAWDLLAREPKAVLVDCRSQAEWSFVGLPDLGTLARQPVLSKPFTFDRLEEAVTAVMRGTPFDSGTPAFGTERIGR